MPEGMTFKPDMSPNIHDMPIMCAMPQNMNFSIFPYNPIYIFLKAPDLYPDLIVAFHFQVCFVMPQCLCQKTVVN